MGAALCWTSWLKEEATLRLVGKSTTVLCGDCSSTESIWADTAVFPWTASLHPPLSPLPSHTPRSHLSVISPYHQDQQRVAVAGPRWDCPPDAVI